MTRQPLISVSIKDCEFSFSKGTGKGGQARNKSMAACHCTHIPSGATAYSQNGRSQVENKKDSFLKMIRTKKFQSWLKLESLKKLGKEKELNDKIDDMLKSRYLKIEIKDNFGNWVIDKL